MKYLISSLAVAALVFAGLPALAEDTAAPAPAASAHTAHTAHIAHKVPKAKKPHAKTHGAGMAHHHGKGTTGKTSVSPDHSADSLNAQELERIQPGK